MKKIAILGCENSHADAFLACIGSEGEFSDVSVVGVYSNERAAAERMHEKYGVPVMEHYADAVGQVDGIMITARHGDNHYLYAKPYIESGIPMFVDKPISNKTSDVAEFMRELRAHGVRVCGGSSLKQDAFIRTLKEDALSEKDGRTVGGYMRAPYDAENEYGGFPFYAPHLVEMISEVFGRQPISLEAKQHGANIHVLFHYENYDCVGLYGNKQNVYYAVRMAERGAHGAEVTFSNDWYYRELAEFHRLLLGAPQEMSYEDFAASVYVLEAIERSVNSGKEEAVGRLQLD